MCTTDTYLCFKRGTPLMVHVTLSISTLGVSWVQLYWWLATSGWIRANLQSTQGLRIIGGNHIPPQPAEIVFYAPNLKHCNNVSLLNLCLHQHFKKLHSKLCTLTVLPVKVTLHILYFMFSVYLVTPFKKPLSEFLRIHMQLFGTFTY